MKIDILTLFPRMFDGFLNESIIKRAIEKEKVMIQIHNIRDYSKDPHKKVDDYAFGGGSGMVLMPQPIFDAVESIKTEESNDTPRNSISSNDLMRFIERKTFDLDLWTL